MQTRRTLLAAPLIAVPALLLASCASGSAGASADDDAFTVVASTSVYASLAEAVAGDAASVEAIIDSGSQDPHEYEATARDQLALDGADLVIMNGGGYDAFMEDLLEASGSDAEVLTVAELSDAYPAEAEEEHSEEEHDHAEEEHSEDEHIEGFNEHVWYDPHTIEHFVAELEEHLAADLPEDAEAIAANADAVRADLEALEGRIAEVQDAHAGATVFFTEPIGGYLAAEAGLEDVTTEGFAEAVEEGQDVAPATLLAALTAIEDGDVDVLVVNAQTGGSETDQLIQAAGDAGVPVVEFAETLPEGSTYVEWMTDNVDALDAALAG
ncbi:metal ABC transporter solute-binding protein, Zn/Mn family [Microbacterium excoecariae]|uniref:metal ABC transporter solute-binding protein, Zn/Mn family n=1 Tax=Microbacterium excoecariae TaxID=2715210 RepID=UPI00140997C1|nr:zinc ABC transporter substrate-binding protein [Microbacterium excoecariae]NHI16055.1 zinc ABC transporter solute-binding protein [Microbacterium excoecariae]